jgi:hypothetical protein
MGLSSYRRDEDSEFILKSPGLHHSRFKHVRMDEWVDGSVDR